MHKIMYQLDSTHKETLFNCGVKFAHNLSDSNVVCIPKLQQSVFQIYGFTASVHTPYCNLIEFLTTMSCMVCGILHCVECTTGSGRATTGIKEISIAERAQQSEYDVLQLCTFHIDYFI